MYTNPDKQIVGVKVVVLGEELMRQLAGHIYEQTKNWETADADYTKYHERAK